MCILLQALFVTYNFRRKAWYIFSLVLKELYVFASNVLKTVLCTDAKYQCSEL
jgi:hypothetical protein